MTFIIVEDDRDVCLAMTERLRDIRGSSKEQILSAFSAEEALSIIQKTRIDCLITDIRMKGMDGLDLMEKTLLLQPHVKCIVVTAYDDFQYAHRALRLGAVDFLLKPFTRQALSEAMNRACTKNAEPAEPILSEKTKSVEWVREYARAHMRENVDMEFMAEQLHMSYSHFSRMFKEKTGQTFQEAMLEIRMDEACRQLLKGASVSEAADFVGYNSINNFTRAFTKHFGQPPLRWLREQNQERSETGDV